MDGVVMTSLRIGPEHLAALAAQGFVACEIRRGRPLYKLRFRFRGRQIVRSLGSDPIRARQVADELARLQAPRRDDLRLRQSIRRAGRRLRAARQKAAPLLEAMGYAFHGTEIRRRRAAGGECGGAGAPPRDD